MPRFCGFTCEETMTDPTPKTCGTCAAWRRLQQRPGHAVLGACTLTPAVYVGDGWDQPTMRDDDGCMQHRPANPPAPTCCGCKWWRGHALADRAECHRRAPGLAPEGYSTRPAFPVTTSTNFCGEFDPK